MSKIEELNDILKKLKDLVGYTSNENALKLIQELEEKIIQDKVVPAVKEMIEPVLSQFQRNIVLIVDYSPEEGVKVKMSEKRNSSDMKLNIATIQPTTTIHKEVPQKAYVAKTISNDTERKSKTVLRVTFSDGTVICERVANDTMIECIKKIGIQTVADLCYTHPGTELRRNGVNLVTKQRSEKYPDRQTSIGNGWLVFNCTSTKDKKKQLMAISDSLGLKLKVEIV